MCCSPRNVIPLILLGLVWKPFSLILYKFVILSLLYICYILYIRNILTLLFIAVLFILLFDFNYSLFYLDFEVWEETDHNSFLATAVLGHTKVCMYIYTRQHIYIKTERKKICLSKMVN